MTLTQTSKFIKKKKHLEIFKQYIILLNIYYSDQKSHEKFY